MSNETNNSNNTPKVQNIPQPVMVMDSKYKVYNTLIIVGALFTLLFIVILFNRGSSNAEATKFESQVSVARENAAELRKALNTELQNYCENGWKPIKMALINAEINGVGNETAQMDKWNNDLKQDCSKLEIPADLTF